MKEKIKIYDNTLGLDGTIPQLIDWANRYTDDYSDSALQTISNMAKVHGFGIKESTIPLLLIEERRYENDDTLKSAYARLKIDHLLGSKISLSISNYHQDGTELEIYEDRGSIIISLTGQDNEGIWSATNIFTTDAFCNGDTNWLDQNIAATLFYAKVYENDN